MTNFLVKGLKTLQKEGFWSFFVKSNRFLFLENTISKKLLKKCVFCNKIGWLVYSTTMRLSINCLHRIRPFDFTDADPFKIIWVNPHEIEYISDIEMESYLTSLHYGRVLDISNNTSVKHKELLDIKGLEFFIKGEKEWDETNLPKDFQEIGRKWASSEQERKASFRNLAKLLKQSYLPQRQLWHENSTDLLRKCNDSMFPFVNEITVSIDKQGKFLKQKTEGGRHRLAISKILDLDEVPVIVMARHIEWQKVRNDVRAGKISVDDFSHPDLLDLK